MPECSAIQTCVCYGRGIQQQGCGQDGCCQIFQSGSHINRQVPETFAQSPLPLETFLRIQTWHTKYSRFDKDYALDFNVWLTGVAGLAFNISTLQQRRLNTDVEWTTDIAQTDLLDLYDLKDTLKRTLWALGLEWTPELRDPSYRHPLLEPIHQRVEPVPKSRRTLQTTSEEASLPDHWFRLFRVHTSTDWSWQTAWTGLRAPWRMWPCWDVAHSHWGSLLGPHGVNSRRTTSTRELAFS